MHRGDFLYKEQIIKGKGEHLSYEIRYPTTENRRICQRIEEIVECFKAFFEKHYGSLVIKKLENHKSIRAFLDIYVTFCAPDLKVISIVAIISGYDGAVLADASVHPFVINDNGYFIPLKYINGNKTIKKGPFFLDSKGTARRCNSDLSFNRIRIKRQLLFELYCGLLDLDNGVSGIGNGL